MVNLIVKNIENNEIVVDIIINKCNNGVVELVETVIKPYINNPKEFAEDLFKYIDRYGSNIDTQGIYKVEYIQID